MTTPKRNEAVVRFDCESGAHMYPNHSTGQYVLHSDYAALQGEVSRLRADAMRYRYLRAIDDSVPVPDGEYPSLTQWKMVTNDRGSGRLLFGAELDRAIDKELNLEPPTDGR